MSKTYEAMNKITGQQTSGWHFLDLKNKKQSGDLEKKIFQLRNKNSHNVFNFTSSRGREGTSTVIANLANYIKSQKIEKKFLLIDANLQRPNLHAIFNAKPKYGLSDVLADTVPLDDAISTLDTDNISALFRGDSTNSINDNISQEKFEALLAEAKEKFDYILIDSAPILVSPNAITVSAASDVTFLIIQSIKVQKEVAIKTKNILQDNECQIGGVILNHIKQVIPGWVYKFI